MPRRPNFEKDDLICRARDLFWRQGWAGTSLKDIEKTLALNPGSIYAAFGSKDELYELALDKYIADGTASLNRMADEKGPLAALQTYPKSVLQNRKAAARACMLAKTYMELSPQNHPLAEKAGTQLRAMEGKFEALFSAAQSNGQIGADHNPKQLAQRYQSDLLGLRLSAERADFDAVKTADSIAEGLARL
ncbi:TetR/AcrR family transcriptional regulator [Tateyamaria sp.]|uniref:TetR/AcrR family transcriptional regulator n=1 Tax=Tateyamaria sp. TaxID=1929288 RepID=UPI00329BD2B4